ncbi:hypothetical protein MNB_SM-4-954 [hydrothermal vent metagenome]|uniref:Uncharacterized protein n=1 Tax=hydrothermal vent metagenome TaxID=652676 RepID=A0A1W1C602_9ZZZZ
MNTIKLFLSILLVITTLSLSGCQGSNSDPVSDAGTTTGGIVPVVPDVNDTTSITVVLPVSSAVLTTNSQVVNIDVRVFDSANNPYSTGTITKVNPSDVLLGRDVGTFDKQVSTITNGIASFAYTAPADLDANTSNILFSFYHDSNATDAKIFTMSLVPDVNQSISTSYQLRTSSVDGVSMALESSESVSYSVYDLSDGSALVDADMISMTVTSLNTSLANLTDSKGNSGTTLTVSAQNNISLNVNSNTKSGLVPIKVVANFRDANGIDQNLTEVFSMLILSGPPSAISLSYASTEQVAARAKFIEKWVVTVTDKYSNLVNSNPSVSMGMIAGYTQSSAATANVAGYLHYLPGAGVGGSINATSDDFTALTAAFTNVDDQNDILVVYGTGYKYDASGKWDITTNSSTVLDLVDDYNSTTRSEMGFAVGNNQREDTCDIGSKWVANVYADGNTAIIDSTGTMVINVEYDYYLTGKSTMLWVNLVGIQNSTGEQVRIGEAKKITLRANGLTGETYVYAKGFNGQVRLEVKITGTSEYYHNSRFSSHVVVTGDDTNWTYGNFSSDGNTSEANGITSCINGGVGYVDIHVFSALDAGEIQLTNVVPNNEF